MALHAVENLGDALAFTREFLTPIEPRRWLVLAVVVFFIGTGTSFPTTQFNTSGAGSDTPVSELPVDLTGDVALLAAGVVGAAILLAVAFGIVGAIMEFVFIESLRTGDVTVRRYWSDRWTQGLRLFGFRIVIWLPMLALSVVWLAAFVGPLLLGVSTPGLAIAALLVGIPILLIAGILTGLVSSFTTVFVVPLMIQQDSGVLAGWRRLWPSLKREWKQYLVYAVLAFVLAIAAGIAASLIVGITAVVLLIPTAIVGVVTAATLSLSSIVGLAILAALAVGFLAAVTVVWAIVQVPIVTYLRSYALLVLGDVDDSFDIIPEQRAAVRNG